MPLVLAVPLGLALAVALALTPACQPPAPPAGPRVVARVDGSPVELWELDREYRRRPAPADATPEVRFAHARRLLDEMIEHRVLVAEARRRGLWPPVAQVEAAYAARVADYPTERTFIEALLEEGHTIERFRVVLSERLAVERLLDEVRDPASAPADAAAIAAYYAAHPEEHNAPEEVRALHIVVPTIEEAKQIREEIVKGRDFATVARERSSGPEAASGGELGYYAKGIMPEGFDVVFDLAPGAVSAVVETDAGFHLFKLVDRRPAHVRALPEVEDAVRRKLAGPALAADERAFVAKLREAAIIEVDEALVRELR